MHYDSSGRPEYRRTSVNLLENRTVLYPGAARQSARWYSDRTVRAGRGESMDEKQIG